MASNGRPPVLLTSELGTAVNEHDRLFLSFEDGAVFSPQDFEVDKVERMLKVDGKAASIEQVLTLPLRGAKWEIVASKDDNGQTEFVQSALTIPDEQGGMSTPLDLVLSQMTAAVLFRRAYFEKLFKVEDGRVVYDKLAWRPPASCRMKWNKRDGSFKGFEQYVGTDPKRSNVDERGYVLIPPERAFVFTHGQHRRPLQGTSDLEAVFNIWQTKQKVRFLWAAFLENQSTPKMIAQHGTQDDNQIQAFAKKGATLKGGGVLGIGPDQSVTVYESNGSGADQFEAAMRYLDAEMSGAVLAGFTDLTAQAGSGRGSYALSESATTFFKQSRQAVLTEMGAAFKAFVIRDLVRWNFGTRTTVPDFKFQPITDDSVAQALDLFKSMATASAVNPAVPAEFIEALIQKVASYLGMPEDKIAEALRSREAQTPTDELRHAITVATERVQEAGVASGNGATAAAPA